MASVGVWGHCYLQSLTAPLSVAQSWEDMNHLVRLK
jgi:hypothetical protein